METDTTGTTDTTTDTTETEKKHRTILSPVKWAGRKLAALTHVFARKDKKDDDASAAVTNDDDLNKILSGNDAQSAASVAQGDDLDNADVQGDEYVNSGYGVRPMPVIVPIIDREGSTSEGGFGGFRGDSGFGGGGFGG